MRAHNALDARATRSVDAAREQRRRTTSAPPPAVGADTEQAGAVVVAVLDAEAEAAGRAPDAAAADVELVLGRQRVEGVEVLRVHRGAVF